MDTCPHCGAPGAFSQAPDGRCPTCGMALPTPTELASAASEATLPANGGVAEAADTRAMSEPDTSTLLPPEPAPSETSTIALPEDWTPEDTDDGRPKGEDLIKPRDLSPEYARRVTAAWQQTRSQFNDPKETLKTETSGVTDVGELNVGHRAVGSLNDAGEKDYELTEVLGEGAMGTVWSARQTSLDRNVAIKMPKGPAVKTEFGRRQFMSEVVVTGQLDHPNIVPIYDLGKDAAGSLFYSMKRVEGRPWNELLEERELDQQENLEILMKVCDAIRFAHDRGVIHRDIKPHNVMVGQYGEVSVMDWGIALRLDTKAGDAGIAKISPAGTPAYMAPEMATGAAGDIGPPTDVYLLGAVLYEVLTGEPPHPPPTDSEVQLQILQDALLIAARNEITPITQGGELNQIAYRAMATEVGNRYQSVAELQDAIRDYLSHAESINLTERGETLLERAKTNGHTARREEGGRFDDFDRARFAFEEAVKIWPGNRAARGRHAETLLAYANYAHDEGAYARGIALLSEDNPDHTRLLKKLKRARRRTNSLAWLLRAAIALIIVGGSVFSFFLYKARNEAENQRAAAVESEERAVLSAKEAQEQRDIAQKNEKKAIENAEEAKRQEGIALKNEQTAIANAEEAKRQEGIALKNEQTAKANAEEATRQEGIAKDNEVKAQRSSYNFEIGLAAEELQRNAFDRAAEILQSQADNPAKRPLRNWEWDHLKDLASRRATTFSDQGVGRVDATAISGDRKLVAAGTDDGKLFVWGASGEKPMQVQYGEVVNAVAITSDGSTVLAAGRQSGASHAVLAWTVEDLRKGRKGRELFTHDDAILSLDLSSDSSRVLAATANGTALLSSIDGGGMPVKFKPTKTEKSTWSARFSDDDRWIVTAGDDGAVMVWDVSGGTPSEVRRLFGHEGPVYTAAFSPDGQYIVSGGRDHKLISYAFDPQQAGDAGSAQVDAIRKNLENEEGAQLRRDGKLLGQHDGAVRSISFAENGNVLYSGGHDHTVRVWDFDDRAGQAQFVKSLRGHGGWVRSCVAAPGTDSSVLSGGYDGRVRIWDWKKYNFPLVLTQDSQRSFSGASELTAGAVAPGGEWIAAASNGGVITIWDMSNPDDPKPQELGEGHDWQATTAVYFPDKKRLLTAAGDNSALIWDEQNGNELLRLGGRNASVGSGWRGKAAVSSDGRWIATGAGDGREIEEEAMEKVFAVIWNADSGDLLKSIPTPDASGWSDDESPEVTALAFSIDDDLLVMGDQRGNFYLASKDKDWRLESFPGHDGKISAIEFLPDSAGFLSASSDGTVQLWTLDSGRPESSEAFAHQDRVVAFDLSEDGSTLITASGSKDDEAIVRIWDRSRPAAHTRHFDLQSIDGDRAASDDPTKKDKMVLAVSLHPEQPQALVTVFDPQDSTYSVWLWNWDKQGTQPERIPTGGLRDVSTALFAPHRDGVFLTVGGRGAQLRNLAKSASPVAMTYRQQSEIRSVSFSPDGATLASASKDGSVKIWKLDQASRRWEPETKLIGQHKGSVNSVAFHPTDNGMFVTASDDGTAKLWQHDGAQWTAVRTLPGPGGDGANLHDANFVPGDEIRIVVGGEAGAQLWTQGDNVPGQLGSASGVCCVAPSPEGDWIVVSAGSQATVYSSDDLKAVAELAGHSEEITSVAFTPNGARLFTGSRDLTVKLWATPTRRARNDQGDVDQPNEDKVDMQRELLTLDGHTDQVTSVSVASGEGGRAVVLTSGLDGQAILWPSAPQEP